MEWAEWLDTVINLAWIAGALAFFLYQALSGAFFPTTTVLLRAERVPGAPARVRIEVVLERGDTWMVEVESAALLVDGIPRKLPLRPVAPRRHLRLGPKERTQLAFILDLPPERDLELTAVVACRTVAGWGRTLSSAQTIVPAAR